MDMALELGINFFDTADVYGWKLGEGITAPIIGPRTIEPLTGSLRPAEIALSDEQKQQLDQIWPGSSGEAPEAYAW
jgi:aryl-alcohol dehydrogenase-like predicted oxidoreductase